MSLDSHDQAPPGAADPPGGDSPSSGPTLPGGPPTTGPGDGPLPRGAAVGRYLIVDVLGAGGMGRVYAAYDPVLDRRVALKLLRGALPGASEGQARLLREAQAMARLSHPNVLVVHDVGTHEGQVFVAMELVDGGTLADWLATPRALPEVLRVFRDAALGLAAAHAVGIVHRDFKPENVLLGRGGRVYVADFGLARSTGEAEPAPLPRPGEDPGALAQRLTQTGALVGTPAYMAPEQFLGWPSDARTDQFSYCVALYEALYRQRPFAGDRAEALALAALEGQVRPPPEGRAAPPWLHALVLRGLSPRPGDRFPDMEALLGEIDRHEGAARRRRRRLAYGGAAALALLGAALLGQQAVSRRARLCGGAEAQLAGVWDGPRREAARRALLASGKPYAASVFAEVDRALSAYVGAWAAMRRDACEATRVRGDQSEALLDLRMTCLDQRRREARALSDLLASSGATLAERAASAAHSLTSLQGCADGAALRALVRPPTAEAAARVQAARAQLARGKVLRDAGQYAAGLPVAREAVAAARAIGYAPLLAEALYLQGDLQAEGGDKAAEETLREAVDAAIAGRHGRVAAAAAARLVFVTGFQLARPKEGHLWRRQGEAHLQALGGDDEERARLLASEAGVLIAEGRYADARAPLQEALELRRRVLGPAHPAVAQCLLLLGNVAYFLGRYDEALGHYRAALPIWERAQGPAHPYVAYCLSNIGAVEQAQGAHAAAVETERRAIAIEEAALGPEHPSLADPLDNLGSALSALGRDEEAVAPLRRAVALYEKALGPEHRDLALHLRALGDVLRRLGRRDEAGALLERARRIQEQSLGGDHPDLAETLASLGALRRDAGDRRAARALLGAAAAMAERKLGAAHPSTRRYREELAKLPP